MKKLKYIYEYVEKDRLFFGFFLMVLFGVPSILAFIAMSFTLITKGITGIALLQWFAGMLPLGGALLSWHLIVWDEIKPALTDYNISEREEE